MKKSIIFFGIAALLAVGAGVVFFSQSNNGADSSTPKDGSGSSGAGISENVEVRDGIQYVTIRAKGGYSPKSSNARANMPTKLIVKTSDTYDCSLALVIRSIGYRKTLPQTGEETIDLGVPEPGTIQGVCGMGMYSFSVKFS